MWSPFTMTTGASNYCHFPHSMEFLVEAMPESMNCQYTSNRNMDTDFVAMTTAMECN